MTLTLSDQAPFAQGGNRLCFVHPEDPGRCVKVRRPDFSLADRRRKKGFPKNLKPLSSFDDNLEEARVMASLEHRYGDRAFRHISRCFGFVDTDMGRGLVSELIRDSDGAIAQTLKKVLWDEGFTDECRSAVETLSTFWEREAIPSRDLLLHNIVVQRADGGGIQRLVVIDGLGSAGLVPAHWLPIAAQRRKAARKTSNLLQRIDTLIGQRGQETFPGYHGLLLHDDRPEHPNQQHPGGSAPHD
ncbi:YrbL family protein [Marinobacter sp. C2H3]|uniref:YrbL family protein n=1 Tax=Marinobacter sp. C2H3 TaxID=3119003 RepID=UPI00300F47CE